MKILSITALFLFSVFAHHMAFAQVPVGLVFDVVTKTLQKTTDERLDEIMEDLNEIKTDIKALKTSPLRAALSALDDARKIKNEDERIHTIRSAKEFLLAAIHLQEDAERVALAHYTLGHVYLLLKEIDSAKSHFKEVLTVKTPYGKDGYWNSKRVYNQSIMILKRESSSILCAFNVNDSGGIEDGIKVKVQSENWCALYLGYRDKVSDSVKDLEKCIRSKNQLSCENLGKKLLISYIDENSHNSLTDSSLVLSQPFSAQHQEDVVIASSVLLSACSNISNYDTNAFINCHWMARALFQKKNYTQALKYDYELCKFWINSQKEKDHEDFYEDEEISNLAKKSCSFIYKEPLWSLTTEAMKIDLVQTLCTRGDLIACGQLFNQFDFYAQSVRSSATYLANSCWVEKNRPACDLTEKMTLRSSLPNRFYKLKINRLEIGLDKDGGTWDVRGDQNPDVRVMMFLKLPEDKVIKIYQSDLNVKELRTDASGNPISYLMDIQSELTIYVDALYFKPPSFIIKIYDVDPGYDDLIGEQLVTGFGFQKSFGSVLNAEISVIYP